MFEKYKNLEIELEKLEDTRFEGKHPNGYNPGHVEKGRFSYKLSTEYKCIFMIQGDRYFHTSEVREIEEKEGYDLIHTRNSVYKLTPLFTSIPGVQEKYSVKVVDEEEKA